MNEYICYTIMTKILPTRKGIFSRKAKKAKAVVDCDTAHIFLVAQKYHYILLP